MADSFNLKLSWADDQLQQLDSTISAWVERESERIIDEPDPQPSREQLQYVGAQHRRFRVTDIERIPDSFSLMIGDCVHNMRSTLDHLALALGKAYVRRQHSRKMTINEEAGSEFPIFCDRAMRSDEELKRIGCMDPQAQGIIKNLQPHLRGSSYRDDPLWRLHELDRIDKHRRLTLCAALNTGVYQEGGIAIVFQAGEKIEYPTVVYRNVREAMKIEPGAILSTYSAIPKDPGREVKLQPSIPLQIAFDKGETLEFQPVVPTLKSLSEFIRSTIFPQLTTYL